MRPRKPWEASLALDALILAGFGGFGLWVASRAPAEVEAQLGLVPTEVRFKQDHSLDYPTFLEGYARNRRVIYEAAHPRSPLTVMNRIPGVLAVKDFFAVTRIPVVSFVALFGLGVGLTVLRHPPTRQGPWGPGLVAAVVGLILTSAVLANELVLRRFEYGYQHNPGGMFWVELLQTVSTAIMAAWLTLAAGSGWHPEPGWRARLGRGVGWTWLFLLLWESVLEELART